MADPNRPDPREGYNPPEAGHRANHARSSWIDGLPHNFAGWGPRTPDPDSPEAPVPTDDDLLWNGEGEHHHHYVWSFQRPRRHHH